MAITCLKDRGTVQIPVTELARFAYPKENPRELSHRYGFVRDEVYEGYDYGDRPSTDAKTAGISAHNAYETDMVTHAGISREVPLEIGTVYEGLPVTVNGIADIVAFDGISHTVEEVKTKAFLPYSITPFDDPSVFAQAASYAHMLAESEGLSHVRIRITFVKRNTGDRISFSALFAASALKSLFQALIQRAGPFLKLHFEKATLLPEEIVRCPFPFKGIRDGQRDFVLEAFRTVKSGGQLFVSAPTGIGKTMASLYPAVKGIGIGEAERIFYLTSKTVTGLAALDAARTLIKSIPHLRAIMITAKEMQCPHRAEKAKGTSLFPCSLCENRNDGHSEDGTFLS